MRAVYRMPKPESLIKKKRNRKKKTKVNVSRIPPAHHRERFTSQDLKLFDVAPAVILDANGTPVGVLDAKTRERRSLDDAENTGH